MSMMCRCRFEFTMVSLRYRFGLQLTRITVTSSWLSLLRRRFHVAKLSDQYIWWHVELRNIDFPISRICYCDFNYGSLRTRFTACSDPLHSMSPHIHSDLTAMQFRIHVDFTTSPLRGHTRIRGGPTLAGLTWIQLHHPSPKGKMERVVGHKGKRGSVSLDLILTWHPQTTRTLHDTGRFSGWTIYIHIYIYINIYIHILNIHIYIYI